MLDQSCGNCYFFSKTSSTLDVEPEHSSTLPTQEVPDVTAKLMSFIADCAIHFPCLHKGSGPTESKGTLSFR